MQLAQDVPGDIIVKLVVVKSWTKQDELSFVNKMKEAIGLEWGISIMLVDSIDLTVRGKHRFVIQNIPLKDVWSGSQLQ